MSSPAADAQVKVFQEELGEILQLCIKNKVQPMYITTHVTTYFELQIKAGTIQDYKYTFPAGMTNPTQIVVQAEVWFNPIPYRFLISNTDYDDPISAYDRAMGVI